LPVYEDALLVGGAVAGLWLRAVIGPNAGVLYGKKTRDDLHRKKIKTKERQVERTEREMGNAAADHKFASQSESDHHARCFRRRTHLFPQPPHPTFPPRRRPRSSKRLQDPSHRRQRRSVLLGNLSDPSSGQVHPPPNPRRQTSRHHAWGQHTCQRSRCLP